MSATMPKLPAGPYPSVSRQYGSEYFHGSKQSISKTAKITIGVVVLVLLLIFILILVKGHNKMNGGGAYYYF